MICMKICLVRVVSFRFRREDEIRELANPKIGIDILQQCQLISISCGQHSTIRWAQYIHLVHSYSRL